jgi:DNA (cytosine-5)-methyltransferase 1
VLGSRFGDAPVLEGSISKHVTVADAFDGLPELTKYRRLLTTDEVQLDEEDLVRLLNVGSRYAKHLVGVTVDSMDMSVLRRYNPGLLTGSLRTVHTKKTVQRFARTPQGEAERVSRLFRLSPDGWARTLRAGTGNDRGSHTSPRPIHPVKNRVITVREAARLHGYPDWFRFNTTNWHGHRQVGNSVPPPLAAAAGRALLAALGIDGLIRPTDSIALGDPSWLSFNGSQARAELRRQSDEWAAHPRSQPPMQSAIV